MRTRIAILLALSTAGLAGCGAHDDREWMKVNQQYTTAEFQRDHKQCSKKGDLDDACMRERGWVPVHPSKSEAQPHPDATRRPRY